MRARWHKRVMHRSLRALTSLCELHLVHALACVPVEECLPAHPRPGLQQCPTASRRVGQQQWQQHGAVTHLLNMAVNCSLTRLNISWMAVVLPTKVAAIFRPFGGISHTLRTGQPSQHGSQAWHRLQMRFRPCQGVPWLPASSAPGLDVVGDPLNEVAAVLVLHVEHLLVHLLGAHAACRSGIPGVWAARGTAQHRLGAGRHSTPLKTAEAVR